MHKNTMNSIPPHRSSAFANVHKSFGALKVLDGVSFEVDRGEVLVIIGRSGSGKSTALALHRPLRDDRQRRDRRVRPSGRATRSSI